MKRVRDPDHIRAVIAERRYTQREMARLARCSKGFIHKVTNGGRVRDDVAKRFARSLKMDVDELFVDESPTAELDEAKSKAVA